MVRVRRWRRLDVPGNEEFSEDGVTFRGRVQVHAPRPWSAEYLVTFDPDWSSRSAEISLTDAEGARRLDLRRDAAGRWFASGREVESCRDAMDVDLGLTPSTNTSAIRRLGLELGQSAMLTATWVRFPSLSVEPLTQRYSRLSDRTFSYESFRDGVAVFQARLEVDASGLVERYERLFERVDTTH